MLRLLVSRVNLFTALARISIRGGHCEAINDTRAVLALSYLDRASR